MTSDNLTTLTPTALGIFPSPAPVQLRSRWCRHHSQGQCPGLSEFSPSMARHRMYQPRASWNTQSQHSSWAPHRSPVDRAGDLQLLVHYHAHCQSHQRWTDKVLTYHTVERVESCRESTWRAFVERALTARSPSMRRPVRPGGGRGRQIRLIAAGVPPFLLGTDPRC